MRNDKGDEDCNLATSLVTVRSMRRERGRNLCIYYETHNLAELPRVARTAAGSPCGGYESEGWVNATVEDITSTKMQVSKVGKERAHG